MRPPIRSILDPTLLRPAGGFEGRRRPSMIACGRTAQRTGNGRCRERGLKFRTGWRGSRRFARAWERMRGSERTCNLLATRSFARLFPYVARVRARACIRLIRDIPSHPSPGPRAPQGWLAMVTKPTPAKPNNSGRMARIFENCRQLPNQGGEICPPSVDPDFSRTAPRRGTHRFYQRKEKHDLERMACRNLAAPRGPRSGLSWRA